MTILDVMNWIKTLETKADNYYAGTLDSKRDKSFGIYQRKGVPNNKTAIGGIECTKTGVKGISILIHWTSNSDTTEKVSLDLYECLRNARNATINNEKVNYIRLLQDEPVDVGADENGIFERVIECDIYYGRS